jgi:hypothetical protein
MCVARDLRSHTIPKTSFTLARIQEHVICEPYPGFMHRMSFAAELTKNQWPSPHEQSFVKPSLRGNIARFTPHSTSFLQSPAWWLVRIRMTTICRPQIDISIAFVGAAWLIYSMPHYPTRYAVWSGTCKHSVKLYASIGLRRASILPWSTSSF